MRQVYDCWQDHRQHTRLEERKKKEASINGNFMPQHRHPPRRHAISLTSISHQRTLPANKVTVEIRPELCPTVVVIPPTPSQ